MYLLVTAGSSQVSAIPKACEQPKSVPKLCEQPRGLSDHRNNCLVQEPTSSSWFCNIYRDELLTTRLTNKYLPYGRGISLKGTHFDLDRQIMLSVLQPVKEHRAGAPPAFLLVSNASTALWCTHCTSQLSIIQAPKQVWMLPIHLKKIRRVKGNELTWIKTTPQ